VIIDTIGCKAWLKIPSARTLPNKWRGTCGYNPIKA